MQTQRSREVKSWAPRCRDLYEAAQSWGLDEDVAFHLADRELANWTGDELLDVLRKVHGHNPHDKEGSSTTLIKTASNYISGLFNPVRERWIKPSNALLAASAHQQKALCINARGEFSLQDNDYFAISHVWSEGIQGDRSNRGLSGSILDRVFTQVRRIQDVRWLWLDVLAIPSGNTHLNATEEMLKIDVINNLGRIYTSARGVIVFDALVMRLYSDELADVAVALLCGKWMSRVWTYQEIALARRAIVLTGRGPVEFSDILARLRECHDGLHWNTEAIGLSPEQMRLRRKYRLIYMLMDIISFSADTVPSLADIAFVCYRRTTGNSIDYARAFFPVLQLKWKPGMTRTDGMQAIHSNVVQGNSIGYIHAARIMLMFGQPRTLMWPGWAPQTLCGLKGMIFPKEAGFKQFVKGLVFSWHTLALTSLSRLSGFKGGWLARMASIGPARDELTCAFFYCDQENDETISAVEKVVAEGRGYFLTHETLTCRGITGLLVERNANALDFTGFVYVVVYVDAIEATADGSVRPVQMEQIEWTLHNENPMNDTPDGGRDRVDVALRLDEDGRRYQNGSGQTDVPGRTDLHRAAAIGDLDLVVALLDSRAAIDAVDSNKDTPLCLAASERRPKVVSKLLDAGANINHVGRLGSALTEAILSRTVDCVRVLLERGAPVQGLGDNDFLWPLLCACEQLDMTRLLLEHGADADYANASGLTALLFASRSGNVDVVKALIDGGASITRQASDESKHDALRYAIETQSEDVVAELLFRGADVDASYDANKSPLIVAAEVGNAKVVELLLNAGADISRRTDGQNTALDIARQLNHRATTKLLEERTRR